MLAAAFVFHPGMAELGSAWGSVCWGSREQREVKRKSSWAPALVAISERKLEQSSAALGEIQAPLIHPV